ncbi:MULTISPECIES: universal stress protein [Paenibacillus]|uniref:Nucleotide-binding universal stress UspA family protein n=2 Tax=Paenibacillus TaxID=44249 RepID=A0ABU1J521_9BACL|nr:universal stress protein [Paenibacillus hunanensis]MCL9663095.1 universal stress protein [Paenibacillus hunanensis]MDR6246561.1 nucleotide-binding universal stress UspA family protein [Paenibacillus hunanensis]WPP42114.1 universal stress protein [Paenibacillus hunanensis]GGJ32040.1 universal stress protein UspA [Paenibacillus hunanensis]
MLFSNILLAYDGSKASNKALNRAIELAQANPEAHIDAIHVFDFPRYFMGEGIVPVPTTSNEELYEMAMQTAKEAKRRLDESGITNKYDVEMIQGSAAQSILEFADSHNSDVIIIGSRGLGSIREFVLGSVSHNVVQHARIPVLIVK